MKIFKYIITIFILFSSSVFANDDPDTFLKDSVKEISAFISENKESLDSDENFLRSKVDELVIPKLDIELMSKIVLGKKNWMSMSISEQKEFQLAFRGLMVRTYMKSLTSFDGEKIKFLPYKKGKRDDVARVKSVYLLKEGELHVNYSLKMNDSGSWKVYDINIDGISLLRNYRSDFKNHIEKEGIRSLINTLQSN
jgi:phospholipid transport system substrate-binding protein|tara:strand:+ start:68 stop:655 length:588 start_codon:yes stop_codon:yes gene_type:complete